MNNNTDKTNTSLKENAEIERIQEETKRIKAERLKLELEREELKKNLNLPWYKRRTFLQAFIGVIVLIPLIWFYVKEIAIPLYQAENIKLVNRIEKTLDSLRKARIKFQITKDSLKNVQVELLASYEQLQRDREKLAQRYDELTRYASLTEKERDEFKRKYNSIQKELENSKSTINEMNTQLSEIKTGLDLEVLDNDQVGQMIKRNGYFDRRMNPDGKGFDNKFQLQKNGQIVYDQASGLMWQQSGSQEEMTYEQAKEWIQALNRKGFAGYNDWRLPTLKEAMSLMEPKQNLNRLYLDSMFDDQKWIWTSTLRGASLRWVVLFYDDGLCDKFSVYSDFFVRAVRSGQSSGGH